MMDSTQTSRRAVLGAAPLCLAPPVTTGEGTSAYVEQVDEEDLFYYEGDSVTTMSPSWIFDRVRWRESWTATDPKKLDDLRTYVSGGYLVSISVTPGAFDDGVLTLSDLSFRVSGTGGGERGVLRETLPDAGMYVHPTEPMSLFEPSDRFDYSTPSGLIVEVGRDDLVLSYGVESGDGMVGRMVSLPGVGAA